MPRPSPIERFVRQHGGWQCRRCGGGSTLPLGGVVFTGLRGRWVECAQCAGRRLAWRALAGTAVAVTLVPTALLLLALVLVATGRVDHIVWERVPGWWSNFVSGTLRPIGVLVAITGLLVTAHELGHALCARLLGFRLIGASVGVGPKLLRFRVGGVGIELGLVPLGGATMIAPKGVQGFRRRALAVYGAGVTAEVVLVAILLTAGLDGWLLRTLLAVVVLHALVNLVPLSVTTPWGKQPNDGRRILDLAHASDDAARLHLAAGFLGAAQVALQHGDVQAAVRELERGNEEFPHHRGLEAMLAVAYLRQGDASRARGILHALNRFPAASGLERALEQNNLAWADLLLNEPGLLGEALAVSEQAVRALGWMPAVQNTRGLALIQAGRVDEGLELVDRARGRIRDRTDRASVLCVSALGAARQGRVRAARSDLEHARRLDPQNQLLGRVETETAAVERSAALLSHAG